MSYLALYRKYRPSTFNEVIGQDHIVKTLINQITNERLGHAYLFTGTRGTGKTSVAKIFAKAINCLNPVNGSPCGKCEACKALSDTSNIDVIEIDAASNNGVNEIRELRENVQFPPVSCKYKVYIIDEVHMLTGPAFNALLKTLEEPPKHAVFILATTEVHKIPATILSRCMRFDFRLVSNDQIAQLIFSIYDSLGKKYEKEAIYAIASAGEGSVRDALSIADTALSYNDGILTYLDVMDILGSTNFEVIVELLDGVLQTEVQKILSTINNLAGLGKSMGTLIKDVTGIVRDLIIIKTCKTANDILRLPVSKFEKLTELSQKANEQRLLRVLEIFSQAETTLKYSTQPRIIFETAAIKASMPSVDYNIDALMARIKNVEDKIAGLGAVSGIINKVAFDYVDIKNEKESEQPKDEPVNRVEEVVSKKTSIDSIEKNELKGKLLLSLRKNGAEMLWNILQSVDVYSENNILHLVVHNESDYSILSTQNCKDRIFEALDWCERFDINISQTDASRLADKFEEASEDIKKIFGDDIVIIK